MTHNFNFGKDQNVHTGAGDLNVIGRDLVQNITTTDSYPYLRRLYDAVAGVGASHTSKQQFARGKCLEGTRRAALEEIHEWRLSSDPTRPLCWLSGTAGVGKTAIAMTVAQACEKDGLVASFFFFRSDPKRNNPDALVPTIALGLLTKIPSLRAFIDRQISQNPMLLEAQLEHQFRELVMKPFLQTGRLGLDPESSRKVPNLVIIDGLDECGDEDTQQHILSIIQSSYQQPPSTCPPLKFLVCSRPEAWIREAFNDDLGRLTRYIILNNVSQTDRDIERYFLHEFEAIRTNPKFARLPFPSPWPSNMEVRQLLRLSSHQFHYAATAVRFVKTPYSSPLDQLRTILNYDPGNHSSSSPFPELDQLYHTILSVNPNREKLLSILAAILIAPHLLSLSPETIEFLLCLAPGEVDLTLRSMHSVLDIRGRGDGIGVIHTSFNDYLLDRTRSGIFFIDLPAQTDLLARRWLQALSAEGLGRYSFHQIFKPERYWLYTDWIRFCTGTPQPSQELLADLQNVELSVVLLCHEEIAFDRIFGSLVSWLQKSANARDLDNIIDRFKTRPKRFHVELPSDVHTSEENQAVRTKRSIMENVAILKINGHECLDFLTFRKMFQDPPRSFTLMITDCRCRSNADLASSYCSHKRYETVCMRAAQAHISIALRYPVHSSPAHLPGTLKFLIDSPLLQHCVLESELLAQCQVLFPIADRWMGRRVILPKAKIEEHQKKLLDCLETCHSIEAETLKFQVMWSFDDLGLGWMIPKRTQDRLYHSVLSANRDREKLISILAVLFIAEKYLVPYPKVIEALLELDPGEVGFILRAMNPALEVQDDWKEIKLASYTPLRDYLLDRTRSGIFYIDEAAQSHSIARRWLQALSAERIRRDGNLGCDIWGIGVVVAKLKRMLPFWDVLDCSLLTDDLVQPDDLNPDTLRYSQNSSGRLHLESSLGLQESKQDRAQLDAKLEHAAILKTSTPSVGRGNVFSDWLAVLRVKRAIQRVSPRYEVTLIPISKLDAPHESKDVD
ncbi:hypothetical protein PQX77_005178 [Marasmius sp. AFHP31]|nr:hypothetical protein PQX77_005178 [Marasmius sp. AFHP31]